jgi:hypothetical protein
MRMGDVTGRDRPFRAAPRTFGMISTRARSGRMSPCTFTKVRPRKDHRGVDLISDALPFGRLWYGQQRNRLCAIYFAFLVWDSAYARHTAIAEAAVRPNQGRRSRNVRNVMLALTSVFYVIRIRAKSPGILIE